MPIVNSNEPAREDTIRVVAVDDHHLTHVAIRSLLSSHAEIDLVGIGVAGEEVLQLAAALRPDVLILDLGMPQKAGEGSDGERFRPLATLATLQTRHPGTGVVILSQHLHMGVANQAIQSGVRGYLLKGDDLSLNLPEAVTTVHRGGLFFSKAFSRLLFQLSKRDVPMPLTDRQREVVLAVAKSPNAQYSEIAESLHITESTLKGHLNRVFRVLDVGNFTACLITCMQAGLIPYTYDGLGIRFGELIDFRETDF